MAETPFGGVLEGILLAKQTRQQREQQAADLAWRKQQAQFQQQSFDANQSQFQQEQAFRQQQEAERSRQFDAKTQLDKTQYETDRKDATAKSFVNWQLGMADQRGKEKLQQGKVSAEEALQEQKALDEALQEYYRLGGTDGKAFANEFLSARRVLKVHIGDNPEAAVMTSAPSAPMQPAYNPLSVLTGQEAPAAPGASPVPPAGGYTPPPGIMARILQNEASAASRQAYANQTNILTPGKAQEQQARIAVANARKAKLQADTNRLNEILPYETRYKGAQADHMVTSDQLARDRLEFLKDNEQYKRQVQSGAIPSATAERMAGQTALKILNSKRYLQQEKKGLLLKQAEMQGVLQRPDPADYDPKRDAILQKKAEALEVLKVIPARLQEIAGLGKQLDQMAVQNSSLRNRSVTPTTGGGKPKGNLRQAEDASIPVAPINMSGSKVTTPVTPKGGPKGVEDKLNALRRKYKIR